MGVPNNRALCEALLQLLSRMSNKLCGEQCLGFAGGRDFWEVEKRGGHGYLTLFVRTLFGAGQAEDVVNEIIWRTKGA